MKLIAATLLLLLTVLACTFGAQPPTDSPAPTSQPSINSIQEVSIPNAEVIYYDISGSTESELRAQLDALSPVGYDNYKGDATTNWYIGWNWPGYGTSDCDLTQTEVTYSVKVTMPRWKSPADADPQLVNKWNNYVQALALHETGHVNFVVQNYQSVKTAIQNATCDTAEAAAQAALEPIRQMDIDYDAETGHGATQGARFP